MLVYPGGTIHDIETSGYSFTSNFFSDMGHMQQEMVNQTIYP